LPQGRIVFNNQDPGFGVFHVRVVVRVWCLVFCVSGLGGWSRRCFLYFIPAGAGIKAKVLQKYRRILLQLFELSLRRFGPRIGAVSEEDFPASDHNPTKGAAS
jgi:hypothetical protein